MAAYHAEYLCDLAKPSQVIAIPYVFAMGDNQSHTFTALVYDSDNPQGGLLAGSVAGLVVRPDGGTVPLIGTKESAVREIALPDGTTVQATACTITLIQGCFAYAGQIVIVIRLVDGEAQTAVFAGRGNVTRSLTDTIVDPGDVVTDISTLIAEAESALEQASSIVSYAAQTGHTDAEKAQARANIGAASASDLATAAMMAMTGRQALTVTDYDPESSIFITANGTIQTSSTRGSRQVPVSAGWGAVEVTATRTFLTFVKSRLPDTPPEGTTVTEYLCEGANNREEIVGTKTFDIPSDCAYMVFTMRSGTMDYSPSAVTAISKLACRIAALEAANT